MENNNERYKLNKELAQMLKGGVIMDVTTPEQARIAEEAGAFDHHLGARLRHRPVAQRLQAGAGLLQQVHALTVRVVHGFEEVLHAGQRISQRVQLAPVGHAPARDQFVLGVAAELADEAGREAAAQLSQLFLFFDILQSFA